MFDVASHAYDETKKVTDDPDDPTAPISFGRAETEELVVQTFVLGQWHRRMPDDALTACAVPIPRGSHIRREMLTERAVDGRPAGALCGECFTSHERTRAAKTDQQARAREADESDAWLAEAPRRAEERERRQDEITERLRAIRVPPIKGDK